MRVIFHIDLNAYFASAAVCIEPELAGKPLVITRDNPRSIITTASYQARALGIHSAMPLFQAKKICPDIIVREPDFKLYNELSNQFFSIVASYSPILAVGSIDECYVDVTQLFKDKKYTDPYELAQKIQQEVYDKLHLECSIGISHNKFLAKMASDLKKPMGITILTKKNIKTVMWPLDISSFYGIGKKSQEVLKSNNINTIQDLANYHNYDLLTSIFMNRAFIIYRQANGIDTQPVVGKEKLRSVGNSTTLDKVSNDHTYLEDTLSSLASHVSARAKKRELISNSISITIKYKNGQTITRQTIISRFTNDFEDIISTAKMLFDNNYNGMLVRLLGVSLNNTIEIKNYNQQLSLFDHSELVTKKDDVDNLIEILNQNSNSVKVIKASQLEKKKKDFIIKD